MGISCFHSLLVLLIVVHFCILCIAGLYSLTTDQSALVALKFHINPGSQSILANNWTTATPVCHWIGVTCGGQPLRVIALNLSSMGLEGTIPPHIGNLSSLALLSVNNNSFYGSLPNEIAHLRSLKTLDFACNFFTGEIPLWFWSIAGLENLVLKRNNFLGSVPSSLKNTTSLKKIDLSYNQLSGSISSNFFNASSLQIIVLSFNRLSGRLPVDIVLPELEELYLSGNQLNGQIPKSLFNCRQLKVLSLSSNNFTGAIPIELGNLTMVNELYLSYNNLEGSIPGEIGYLTKIKNLSISHNHLTGHITSSIGNCTLLEEISLSENNLTGALPPEIGNLSNLEALIANNNLLRGNIPSTVFNISTIQVLLLYENYLSGYLPPNMGLFLPNLVQLHLQGNELRGAIPSSISNASRLSLLDLTDNFFTGIIPNSIGNLRNLQKLELARNHLTSESSAVESNFISALTDNRHLKRVVLSGNPLNSILPMSIGNLSTSLEYFLATDCKLKGIIPPELGNLSNLIALKLGKNELTGKISDTIGRLQKLQGLHLQSNRLQGTISCNICTLSSLVELFLGGNELSGSVPECIGNLTALRNISLGFNRLTSLIPSSLWSLKDVLAINMSSNFLIGSFPLEIDNLKVVTEIDLSKNQLSGYVPNSIGNLKNLVYLSLAENKLRGSIPEAFSGSTSLEYLDISSNNLSGVIPMSLVKLIYLKYLNVSSNELQGEIPSGGPFTNFTAHSYVMNQALCGAARLKVPPCKAGNTKRMLRTLFLLLKILLPVIALYYVLLLTYPLVIKFCLNGMKFLRLRKKHSTKRRTILYLEIVLATDGFSESNILGTGAFGSVYKGTTKEEKNVAIKVFNTHTTRALRSFQDERKLLSTFHHPNIVKLFNICSDDDFRALVLEYMPNGTLDQWLYTHNYFLNLLQRLDIMIEVASAMVYLHARHIVHCDLKPSNVLLDEGMVARVSDFSIAKRLDRRKAAAQTSTLATIGYMAPEYGISGIISEKTDVYSFGILLMETFTSRKPTDEMFGGEMNLKRWVYESLPHAVDRITDATLLEADPEALVAKRRCIISIMKVAMFCTAEIPSKRKTMTEVEEELQMIKNKFLRATEWPEQGEIYQSISRQALLLATDGFGGSEIVQHGESCVTYKGTLSSGGLIVAVKVFNRNKKGRERFSVESEVLPFIRHRNVVKFLMICNEVDFKALVLQHMPYGSLDNWLKNIDGISLGNMLRILNMMIDVASALCYLHLMRVIHCNLKATNILLDDKLVAHVSDFGIAQRLGEWITATKTSTMATAGYMAPEYESTGTVSEKTDVYSFGILLMETFTRKKPTDEIFDGDMNFRRWICSSLPHAVDNIVDFTLLKSYWKYEAVGKPCILSIMELASCCTAELSSERMPMTDVENNLKMIKRDFLTNVSMIRPELVPVGHPVYDLTDPILQLQ